MFSSIIKSSFDTGEVLYGPEAGHTSNGAELKSANPDHDAHTDATSTSTANLSDADETTLSESLVLEQDLYEFEIHLLRQWCSTPDTCARGLNWHESGGLQGCLLLNRFK